MQTQKLAIITTTAALLLVASAVSAITPYSVSAKSNAQTSGANNDCPADVFSFYVGVQQQASANCLNDINSVQDSDGASIASTPFNAAPSQALDLKLEFGDDTDGTPPPPPPDSAAACEEETEGEYGWDITIRAPHDDVPVDDDVPIGTIVCIFQQFGNHPASVIEPEGGMEVYTARVSIPEQQPRVLECFGADFQLAEVTSDNGGLPMNLEIGDMLCAKVGPPLV
jgi:hypothetical protein